MPLDDEEVAHIKAALFAEMEEVLTEVAASPAPITPSTVALVAETAHRMGVPVARAYVAEDGCSVVLEIAQPQGSG